MYTQGIACIKTRREGTCPQTTSLNVGWNGGWSLKGTVIKVPSNAFTIIINSTNGNTSIKADFYCLLKNFLKLLKISQIFLEYVGHLKSNETVFAKNA